MVTVNYDSCTNAEMSAATCSFASSFQLEPVYVRGVEVIPGSSIVSGKITHETKRRSEGPRRQPQRYFRVNQTPRPNHYAIGGSPAGAASEGTVKGESAKKRNASFVVEVL